MLKYRFFTLRWYERLVVILAIYLVIAAAIIYFPTSLFDFDLGKMTFKGFITFILSCAGIYWAYKNVWIQKFNHRPELSIGKIYFKPIPSKDDTDIHIAIKNIGKRSAYISKLVLVAHSESQKAGFVRQYWNVVLTANDPIEINKVGTKQLLCGTDTLFFIRIFYRDMSRFFYRTQDFCFHTVKIKGEIKIITAQRAAYLQMIDRLPGIKYFDKIFYSPRLFDYPVNS